MRVTKKQEELVTAYHEAGHAVASRLVQPALGVRRVTIIPSKKDGSLGHCMNHKIRKGFHPDIEVTSATRDRLESHIICFLAGSIAEQKFTGKKPKLGGKKDWVNAISLADYVVGTDKELEAYMGWLSARTEAMFDNPFNWKVVEGVAQALMTERKLSGARFKQVIKESFEAALPESKSNRWAASSK